MTHKLISDKRMRHSHLAVIQKHAVHFLNGAVSGILGLKVDEGVALGAIFITHHLEDSQEIYMVSCSTM